MVKQHKKEEQSVKVETDGQAGLTKSQKKRMKHKQRQYMKSLKIEAQGTGSSVIKTGLQAFISHDDQDQDVNMSNVIATGLKRKLKKKMKKLKKQNLCDDEIFRGIQKARAKIAKSTDKMVFNPKSELVDRRNKRMDRVKANREKRKKEILQRMQ